MEEAAADGAKFLEKADKLEQKKAAEKKATDKKKKTKK